VPTISLPGIASKSIYKPPFSSENRKALQGYEAQIGGTLEPVALAVARILRRLHILPQPPDSTLLVQERNQIIMARFEAGESQANLVRAFGITYQRVHQIVWGKHH
jgi:hypothetical protein